MTARRQRIGGTGPFVQVPRNTRPRVHGFWPEARQNVYSSGVVTRPSPWIASDPVCVGSVVTARAPRAHLLREGEHLGRRVLALIRHGEYAQPAGVPSAHL